MTTVPNSPPAARPARPPITREQLLFIVANAAAVGVSCPIRIEFVELPAGRELELQLADDDRSAVNLYAATFGLPTARESDQASVRGRRSRRWYGTTSAWTENPTFGGWRVSVNCYVTAPAPAPRHPVAAAQPGQVPA